MTAETIFYFVTNDRKDSKKLSLRFDDDNHQRCYSSYTMTFIPLGNLTQAKEHFS